MPDEYRRGVTGGARKKHGRARNPRECGLLTVTKQIQPAGPAMTLGNMRAFGVLISW
jgi:hypothetical protein